MTATHRGVGRRPSNERVRELLSILSSLTEVGDTISVDTLASRLGLDRAEAANLMSMVCQASGEEGTGLLVSANDDLSEFTLEYPGVRGRRLRLTHQETIALLHALDQVGVSDEDPLRSRLTHAYSSTVVDDEEVRQTLGSSADARIISKLSLCARAQAESRMVDFAYRGLADDDFRWRCALVRHMSLEGDAWYVDAYDLDCLDDRRFRVDRMRDIALGSRGRLPDQDDPSASETRLVDVAFADEAYLTLFDWPGLRITRREDGVSYGVMPYYGERSDWLQRRIIACDGTLEVFDERITSLAQEYARNTLAALEG